jgi:F0F1-type ATP synthase assembly protein I
MLPIVFIIVTAILIYRSARDNGYNAILWTVVAVVGYAVIQIGLGLISGIVLALGIEFWGWAPTLIEDYSFAIGLAALVPAAGFVFIIWKYVNRLRDDHIPAVKKSPVTIYSGDD